MEIEIDKILNDSKINMEKSIEHLKYELSHVRTGKASPDMVSDISVESYGAPTPLKHVANISLVDARTIAIQPWDKSQLRVIEQAIFASNIGITPMNDGEFIRLTVPPLTEERRKTLVKQAKQFGEAAKVSLRSSRHKTMELIKKAVKDGLSEDLGKLKEKDVDEQVHNFEKIVDEVLKIKEKEIMTV
ncbi:MAG: ribosome recycling factor [Deltaproteobacteria bacterium]